VTEHVIIYTNLKVTPSLKVREHGKPISGDLRMRPFIVCTPSLRRLARVWCVKAILVRCHSWRRQMTHTGESSDSNPGSMRESPLLLRDSFGYG